MASTQKYLNHLLQTWGITPACSEEERAAAEELAQIFRNHGFTPEVQEFSASQSGKIAQAIYGGLVFVGAVLLGLGGALGVVGFLLALAGAVLYVLERNGQPVLSRFGAAGLSQNVIAYHKAEGPLASPRNRPVVVVAHYDSPRVDLLSEQPFSSYKPYIVKFLPACMIVPVVLAVLRVLPFPGGVKVLLWIAAVLAALVPLAHTVGIIANRFVLPYTSGAVSNRSSVAAMLGVMDAVSPFAHAGEEFPADTPFEEYMAEQQRIAESYMVPVTSGYTDDAENEGDGQAEGIQGGAAAIASGAMAGVSAGLGALKGRIAGARGAVEPAEAEPRESLGRTAAIASLDDIDVMPVPDVTNVMPALEVEDGTGAAPTKPEVEPEPEPEVIEEEIPTFINDDGNIRFGANAIMGLGMVSSSCTIEYDDDALPKPPAPRVVAEPAPVHEEETPVEPAEDEVLESEAAADVAPQADGDFDPEVSEGAAEPAADDEAEDLESAEVESDGSAAEPVEEAVAEPAAPTADATGLIEPLPFDMPEANGSDAEGAVEAPLEADATNIFNPIAAEPPLPQLPVEPVFAGFVEPLGALEAARVEFAIDAEYEVIEPEPEPEVEPEIAEAAPEVTSAEDVEDVVAPAVEPQADEVEVAEQPVETVDAEKPAEDEPVEQEASAVEGTPEQLDATMAQPALDATAVAPAISDEDAPASATATMTMPAQAEEPARIETETVDSLMEQISRPKPRPQRSLNVPMVDGGEVIRQIPPVVPDMSHLQQIPAASRTALFDLPDPATAAPDPFAVQQTAATTMSSQPSRSGFRVIDTSDIPPVVSAPSSEPAASAAQPLKTITAPAPDAEAPARKRGLGKLFGGRKKKDADRMSDWLGVDEDFDAKRDGGEIGSWDNFDDDTTWKGGATGSEDVTEAELRDAITSMGDDELLGHDIWFVATGASEYGNAGLNAFLSTHRDKLRGVFFINLENVGSGMLSTLTTEGESRVLKGDRRIAKLVSQVSRNFHAEFAQVDMPFVETDAHAAMNQSLRALTIAGVDATGLACARTEADQPFNVDPANVDRVADVVTEVIRRS